MQFVFCGAFVALIWQALIYIIKAECGYVWILQIPSKSKINKITYPSHGDESWMMMVMKKLSRMGGSLSLTLLSYPILTCFVLEWCSFCNNESVSKTVIRNANLVTHTQIIKKKFSMLEKLYIILDSERKSQEDKQ